MKAMTRHPFYVDSYVHFLLCTPRLPRSPLLTKVISSVQSPSFTNVIIMTSMDGGRLTSRPSVLSEANIMLHWREDGRFSRFFLHHPHHLLTLVSFQRRPPPTTSISYQSLRMDIHYNRLAMTDVWVVLGSILVEYW